MPLACKQYRSGRRFPLGSSIAAQRARVYDEQLHDSHCALVSLSVLSIPFLQPSLIFTISTVTNF